MLLKFTKKRFFECSEADLLSVSILSELMLLVVGVKKRAAHKEYPIFGMKCGRVVMFTYYTLKHLVFHQNVHTIISLNVLITEKSKIFRIKNNFVASYLYVSFSYFSLLYQICSLIQEVF